MECDNRLISACRYIDLCILSGFIIDASGVITTTIEFVVSSKLANTRGKPA